MTLVLILVLVMVLILILITGRLFLHLGSLGGLLGARLAVVAVLFVLVLVGALGLRRTLGAFVCRYGGGLLCGLGDRFRAHLVALWLVARTVGLVVMLFMMIMLFAVFRRIRCGGRILLVFVIQNIFSLC